MVILKFSKRDNLFLGINQNQRGQKGVLLPDNGSNFELIQRSFSNTAKDFDGVVSISPPEIDIRMMAQLSSFTLHGSGKSINNLPNSENFLINFIIPSDSKEKISKELKYLGVRKSSLFPDLEHLADEIKSHSFM